MTLAEKIEMALFRVAVNVARHCVQRSGYSPDDPCFEADLRQSQAEIVALVDSEVKRLLAEIQNDRETVCPRCEGDGKAHGSDRPFEWTGPGTYPGPCPVCRGSGRAPREVGNS